jgi:hypothetical protein
MSGKGKFRPSPVPPKRKETPRSTPELPGAETSGDRMCWRFKHFDHDGPWSFAGMSSAEMCGLMKRLAQFETMMVGEAFPGSGKPGKEYDVEDIPTAEARKRLDAIGLADMTKISVFRLSGEQRLYGFRCGNVFHVVWWDPQHVIWPSHLKHT